MIPVPPRSLASTVLALGLAVVPASAQLCAGNPALGTALSGNVGTDVVFLEGATAYGASATLGTVGFGRIGFEYTAIDESELSLKRLWVAAGYERVPEGTIFPICPTIEVGYGFGAEVNDVTQTTLFVVPALAAAVDLSMTPTLSVVPFVRIALIFRQDRYDRDAIDAISRSDGQLALGARLIFSRRIAVGPTAYVPIASEGDSTTFGVSASFAFGGAR